jgi:hypothetical protein
MFEADERLADQTQLAHHAPRAGGPFFRFLRLAQCDPLGLAAGLHHAFGHAQETLLHGIHQHDALVKRQLGEGLGALTQSRDAGIHLALAGRQWCVHRGTSRITAEFT